MQIDRLLYPVHSLGPGDRLAIWIRGCKKRCFNCANPELQLFNPNSEVSMTVIKEMISKIDKKIDGITITGGEPFCQAKDLFEIITFMLEIRSEEHTSELQSDVCSSDLIAIVNRLKKA